MSPTTLEDLDIETLWQLSDDIPPVCQYVQSDHVGDCQIKAVCSFNVSCLPKLRLGCVDIYHQWVNALLFARLTGTVLSCKFCNRLINDCWKVTPL